MEFDKTNSNFSCLHHQRSKISGTWEGDIKLFYLLKETSSCWKYERMARGREKKEEERCILYIKWELLEMLFLSNNMHLNSTQAISQEVTKL